MQVGATVDFQGRLWEIMGFGFPRGRLEVYLISPSISEIETRAGLTAEQCTVIDIYSIRPVN